MGKRYFFFSIVSRPVLGPSQPSIEWLPGEGGTVSLGIWKQGHEADHSLPSSVESSMVELYLYSLIYVHGMDLN
jgi:hypothetical protein